MTSPVSCPHTVRQQREALGLSQREIGLVAGGLPRRTVSRYEWGTPPGTYVALLDLLHLLRQTDLAAFDAFVTARKAR